MRKLSQRDQKRFVMLNMGKPDWKPLEFIFTDENVLGNFMYMGAAKLHTGTVVHLYKNSITRRYINIDNSGNTYSYSGEDYSTIPVEVAKDTVLG